MAKRVFPGLDDLDAGTKPVLGIRERAELEALRSPVLGDGFTYDGQANADGPDGIADLFDPYE